jgi:3-oxoacyl-(acyl-carrier-protein) reductase
MKGLNRLEGVKTLVTGASRGIGREIAIKFAHEGADVAVNFNMSEKEADELATEIEYIGSTAWVYSADTSDMAQVRRMKEAIEKHFGEIDVLVNNAGINIDRAFMKMTENDWSRVISVNLSGFFNCTHMFIDHIVKSNRGRVINIASIVGQMGNIGQVNYASSKAGIIGMTKALARELASKKVTVNAIAPGFIETEMVKNIPDKIKEKILSQIPMRRFGQAEEIAAAAVFLASDEASYITGHVLNVNGGMYV